MGGGGEPHSVKCQGSETCRRPGPGVRVCAHVCTYVYVCEPSWAEPGECPEERGSSEVWDGQSLSFRVPLGVAQH